MGLFSVSISDDDRPRIDRLLNLWERTLFLLESLNGKQITIGLEPKNDKTNSSKLVNDIQK